MKKADAISYFGSVAALAKALKITPEAVYQWGPTVPAGRDFQIQVLTNGALQARESVGAR